MKVPSSARFPINRRSDLSLQKVLTIKLKFLLKIIVKDNGAGMDTEKQAKLFNIEKTFSTLGPNEEQGTGLGLILSKEFVEKHGGKIWIKSEENKGSCFIFTLLKVKPNEK